MVIKRALNIFILLVMLFSINVNAEEQIVLSQNSSKITMKDSITVEGSKVYMQ